MIVNKDISRKRRSKRIRAKIYGTGLRPRLCVFRSLKHMYAQIVDDEKGNTLVSFDSRRMKDARNNIEAARKVGKEIAKLAQAKGIKEIVFDRRGYCYHGKVKALAEGAREGGLKF